MYLTKTTHELVAGDVVNCHGLRCLIDGELLVSRTHPSDGPGGHCVYTSALVLDRNAPSAIPRGWTIQPDGTDRWTIQGNALARWHVELA